MERDISDFFSCLNEPPKVNPFLQAPPHTVRPEEDAAYIQRVLGPVPPPPQLRPTQCEDPAHCALKLPCPWSWQPGSSISRPISPSPRSREAMHKIQERHLYANLTLARGPSAIQEDQLDPNNLPELFWPWRWAFVLSAKTTDPTARVLVPINRVTLTIHPSYSNRVLCAATETPVSTTNGSATRNLPIRGSIGKLPPIFTGESTVPARQSDSMKVANLLSDKKDLPSREAHVSRGDELPPPYSSIENFEDRFSNSTNPSSTTTPEAPSPIASPRLPGGGVPFHPPNEEETEALARLNTRLEHPTPIYAEMSSNKESDDLRPRFEAKEEKRERIKWLEMSKQLQCVKEKMEQAQRSVGNPVGKDRSPTQPKLTVRKTSAQKASKVAERKFVKGDPKTDSLVGTGKRNKTTIPKCNQAHVVNVPNNIHTQATGNVTPKDMKEYRKESKGAENAGIPQSWEETLALLEKEYPPRQWAPDTKHERWLVIDAPNISQEEFEELALESDEEDWEKVSGDEEWEWEVFDDPRVEVERKANLQRKMK